MKKEQVFLLIVVLLLIGSIAVDRFYLSKFEENFKEIEKKRIDVSNKLNTAKIISEDFPYVKDLVFKNMDFPGHNDTISHETAFFDFVTECVNDLKMTLVSVQPSRPKKVGRVTYYGYEIVVEGDFFSFGELSSKFENSRRIISLETFDVQLISQRKGAKKKFKTTKTSHKGISVTMFLNTYRIDKGAGT